MDNKKWFVKLCNGHAPEQIFLFCPDLKIIISGDQILPGISPNLSVYPTEPLANPLAEYLEDCEKLLNIEDLGYLVLPGHNLPFYGFNTRVEQLINHHQSALKEFKNISIKPLKVPMTYFRPFLKEN